MKNPNTLTDSELLVSYEENCQKWSFFSCDCFALLLDAQIEEIQKRKLRPMISIRTCSDKELIREISAYNKHPEAFAYDQVPGAFQGYYYSMLMKEFVLRNLKANNEDSNKS